MLVSGYVIMRTQYRIEVANYAENAMQLIEYDIDWLCRKFTVKNMDPDDLAQELRLHVWRKLDKYDPRRCSFRVWAKQIMRNRIYDLHRKTKKKNIDMLDAPQRAMLPFIENFSEEEAEAA